MKTSMLTVLALSAACATASAQIELTNNGGFEAGDLSGWQSFPSATSTFLLTNDANSGTFAAELFNNQLASGAVIKQANLGIGQVSPGQIVDISFAVKGEGAVGGVLFAEFLSEIDGGGVSSAQILGGGPLAITSSYQVFNFSVLAGPDVSGGVTLQFAAVTGGAQGSTIVAFIDDASVSIIPAPAGLAALGMGGLVLGRRRR